MQLIGWQSRKTRRKETSDFVKNLEFNNFGINHEIRQTPNSHVGPPTDGIESVTGY